MFFLDFICFKLLFNFLQVLKAFVEAAGFWLDGTCGWSLLNAVAERNDFHIFSGAGVFHEVCLAFIWY